MLHLTNGDITADLIRSSEIPGSVMPWRDALHEGPVPSGMTLDELSAMRARFLSGRGWGRLDDLHLQFDHRDQALRTVPEHEEVTLWFEHDLYDQLQLLQILDALSAMKVDRSETSLKLICIDRFAGVPDFRGFEQLRPEQLVSLWNHRARLSDEELTLASRAWMAFRSKTPTDIEGLLTVSSEALPFLQPALVRLLEQYPDPKSGLSRTERQILQALAGEPLTPSEVFERAEAFESAPFMGDTTFWWYLGQLGAGDAPLLSLANGMPPVSPDAPDFPITRLTLTPAGREALAGTLDRLAVHGISRWIGGVQLETPGSIWRWDPSKLELKRGVVGA